MSELILQVFTYGPDQRRAEIELGPKIPVDMKGNVTKLEQWSKELILTLGVDVKHTQQWGCEICGKPARENIYDVMSWIHLPEPRIVIYIHHVCDGDGKCSRLLEAQTQMIARQMGMPAQQPLCLPKEPGAEYPLSSSCAKCHGEATGAPGSKLSRCGTCKLTRYCSVVCQTADWSRHKRVCKTVKSVKWVNWQ